MNAGALKQAVERRSGVSYDATALLEVLNEALQDIGTEERWPWLQDLWTVTIVAGTAAYSPPAGTTSVRSVIVDGFEYPALHIGEIDGDSIVFGWAFEKEQLVLAPTPAGGEVVTARISKAEPTLTADGDTPLLPSEWHGQALVNKAAAIVLERVDDFERADRREKAYTAALKRMRHVANRNRGPRAARVRPGSVL